MGQSNIETMLENIRDGVSTEVEPQSRIEHLVKEIADQGGGSSGGKFVGTVAAGDNFPTTRLDGSPLVAGDFVKPTGSLPFTIGDITFETSKDIAVWDDANKEWILNANAFQNTSETPVLNKEKESLTKTAAYQNKINEQIVNIIGQDKEINIEDIENIIDATVVSFSRCTRTEIAVAAIVSVGFFSVKYSLEGRNA